MQSTTPHPARAKEAWWIGAGLCILSAASYGSAPILGKLGYANGLTLTNMLSIRFGGAAITLFAYLALFQRRTINPGKRLLAILLLNGAIGYAGNTALFFGALQRIPASMASPILFIYPVFVALSEWMITRIPPTRRELAAIATAVVGVFLATGLDFTNTMAQMDAASGLGIVMALGSSVCYTAYVISNYRLTQKVGAWVSVAWVTAGAAASFSLAGWITGTLAFNLSSTSVGILLGMIIFSTIIPLGTFLAGMARTGPTTASLLSTLEPAFTVLLALALLGESLTLLQGVGIGLVLASAILLTLSRSR
jgi:drug/metabolite transporter (DMT)-like permease